jgi:murein L,D-transpeptidase YafK
MAWLLRSIAVIVRFTAAFFCVIVLSPLPDSPAASTAAFLEMLSSLEGNPSVVIWKSQYSLTLYKGSAPVKTYRAVFGKGYSDGDKERSGDRRTPEGEFFVCGKNDSKRFHKFLGLSYPSVKHADQGLRKGFISAREFEEIRQANAERRQPPWESRLGGAIGIHGRISADVFDQLNRQNWTDGCIALTNRDIDELFSVVQVGTPVTILP